MLLRSQRPISELKSKLSFQRKSNIYIWFAIFLNNPLIVLIKSLRWQLLIRCLFKHRSSYEKPLTRKNQKRKKIQNNSCPTSTSHYFEIFLTDSANVFSFSIYHYIFIDVKVTIGHHNVKLNWECMVTI